MAPCRQSRGACGLNQGGQFWVYLLRCADGTYYVGLTSDLPARLRAHNAGRGPRFTHCRRPVVLAHSERFPSVRQARRRETQLKRWSRAKKEALVAGNLGQLKALARSQDG
jgi:predicted GIY-YIG superfamily endonuclease